MPSSLKSRSRGFAPSVAQPFAHKARLVLGNGACKLQLLIEARKAKSDREDDVGFFRFLCAISSRLLRGTGVELPKPDYDLLRETCGEHCKAVNLQLTELFFIKITQLYEMIIVRHGLMIVGYSFGAKTSMYRTLAAALGMMKERGAKENAVSYYVLNPSASASLDRPTSVLLYHAAHTHPLPTCSRRSLGTYGR